MGDKENIAPSGQQPTGQQGEQPAAPAVNSPDAPRPAAPGVAAATPGTPAAPLRAKQSFYDDVGHVPMTEEMDRPGRTLPPLGVVAIALVVLGLIVGIIAWRTQPKPQAGGSIDDIFAVSTSDGKTMAIVKVTFRNVGQGKPLWVRNLKAKLSTQKGDFEDEAANATDFDRYFQAFPPLKEHAIDPLKVETRVPAGLEAKGSLIFAFDTPLDDFNARKSLSVIIEPYDQKPLVITK